MNVPSLIPGENAIDAEYRLIAGAVWHGNRYQVPATILDLVDELNRLLEHARERCSENAKAADRVAELESDLEGAQYDAREAEARATEAERDRDLALDKLGKAQDRLDVLMKGAGDGAKIAALADERDRFAGMLRVAVRALVGAGFTSAAEDLGAGREPVKAKRARAKR